jgi:hypothetical protein
LPSQLSPSPTNGSAVKGTLQSTPDVPRLTHEDQRLLSDVKQANDKLGRVGNPSGTTVSDKQPGQIAGASKSTQSQDDRPIRALPPPPRDSSEVKESTDRGSAQAKSDVSRMSEQDQRLAREIIRDTEKLGAIGNPGGSVRRSRPAQGEQVGNGPNLRRDIDGPHLPVNTMGAASGSAC